MTLLIGNKIFIDTSKIHCYYYIPIYFIDNLIAIRIEVRDILDHKNDLGFLSDGDFKTFQECLVSNFDKIPSFKFYSLRETVEIYFSNRDYGLVCRARDGNNTKQDMEDLEKKWKAEYKEMLEAEGFNPYY